jgi:hypothetical protein
MLLRKTAKFAIKIGLIIVVSLACVEGLMIVFDPYLFKGTFIPARILAKSWRC